MSESKTHTPEPLNGVRLTKIRERAAWVAETGVPADEADHLILRDVPALLGEVDRLRAELAAVVGENNRLADAATALEADRNILRTEQAVVFAALRDALGTSPATVGQAAVHAVKAIEERDTARALLAEAAAEVIRKVIADLEITPCSFWACDGPDKPFVSMKTCRVCFSIQELRKLLATLHGTKAVQS